MQRLMAHGLDASPPALNPPSPHRKHAWPTVVRPRQTAPSTPRKRACRQCLTCPHPATSESPNTCGRSRLSARARGVPAHRRDAGPDAGGKPGGGLVSGRPDCGRQGPGHRAHQRGHLLAPEAKLPKTPAPSRKAEDRPVYRHTSLVPYRCVPTRPVAFFTSHCRLHAGSLRTEGPLRRILIVRSKIGYSSNEPAQ